ncbi:MAG: phosphoglycerate dehydrogenase [Alphaproteobacteria bacterium]
MPQAPKVLISDEMSPRAAEIFRERGLHVDIKLGLKPDQLKEIIGGYHGLAIRSATKVTADILGAAKNLKVIGRAGIGVDNVDVPAATSRGVLVMNTPFGNSVTTAEHAIALMFGLARQLPAADRSTHEGKWEKNRFMGVELTGKTLGIVGCGNIGTIVADRAKGLRMKVLAFDPYLSPQRASDLGIEKVELPELWKRADFITLHTPLTDSTRNLLDAKSFAQMKQGVRIINCARGGLINEADLKIALDSGQVAGAALDVFEVEPAKKHPLFGNEKVICTPHLGASTEEAQENVALQVAEQISDYLLTGTITNPINMSSVSSAEAPRLKPYMKLAEQLGSFVGQLYDQAIKSVRIDYEGEAADLNTRPLTAALLQGLLAPQLDGINLVNAPILAKEREIEVNEAKTAKSVDYQTRIRLTVIGEKRPFTVCGTLVGGDKPRIIQIDDIALEAGLGPQMLFVRNIDKPGFVGRLGNIVAEAGINIATFHLGRADKGGDSIAFAQIDEAVGDMVLMQICSLPNVTQVKLLKF